MKAYQLLITLKHINPAVWRRILIPAETNFKRLHDTIQFAMGWQDYHLHQFEIDYADKPFTLRIVEDDEMYEEHLFRQKAFLSNPPPENDKFYEFEKRVMMIEMRKARTTKLPKYLEKYSEVLYTYDYGDNWEHSVKLEKIVEDYSYGHPVLLEGEGACPPEDVGGPGGYEEFLKAWHDPSHPDHEHMRVWGESQWFQELNIQKTNEVMENVLKLKKVK
ncbi:plasmid pRiA4b ORF-3 family protein [Domibacillus aminovorans]|uniref:Plasmid pRiA4b Orf3-like domain-containing protein n=1 Tax=Domibacillus aminovorans TaxID=29332 RepID=A0A177L2J5_9BACI|nr:plasmid pRiA4b ORF-3 family protein [Domibacillus aminovorans]OAH59879.1 hypothetical protein AWH49_18140 [Domibacillus aminovorans]